MINAIYLMASNTLALLTFCFLGVAGQVESVEVTSVGFEVEIPSLSEIEAADFSFGGIVFFTEDTSHPDIRAHGSGHLLQERFFGVFYPVLVIVPSLVCCGLEIWRYCRTRDMRWINWYNGLWFEVWADELGGVEAFR